MSRARVDPRRSIFIGVEGRSDRTFVRFLGKLCERKKRYLHLNIRPANGGDSFAVINHARHYLSKTSSEKEFQQKLVLLDKDRIRQDTQTKHDPICFAKKHQLEVILLAPNLEGLLLRLHPGYERRQLQARDTKTELKKQWPEYDKSLPVQELYKRFNLDHLHRAAQYDSYLQRLLTILEIEKK